MPSPSTTGRPAVAAVRIGSIELEPPISAEMSAATLTPAASSTPRSARRHSSPCLIFSMPTTGAPMPPTEPTQSSSSSASSGRTSTDGALAQQFAQRAACRYRDCRRRLCRAARRRATAAADRSPRGSEAVYATCRSPTTLTLHARRVAGEIGERHVLDVDDFDRLGARAGGHRDRGRLLLGVLDRVGAAHRGQRIDAIDLARDLRDRRADRVGDGEMVAA